MYRCALTYHSVSLLFFPAAKGLKPGVFYSANECSDSNCGTLASFSWTNVTLVMSAAVTDLGDYMSYDGASSDGLTSSDGGITWTVDAIAMGKDTTWDGQ